MTHTSTPGTTSSIISRGFDKSATSTIKYLTPKQLQSVLDISHKYSVRDYTIILLAYTHGLRITEVSILQLKWYDPATNRITIQRVKKGYRIQYQTSEECKKALGRWLKLRGSLSGPLFPSRKSNLGQVDFDMETKKEIIIPGISKPQLHSRFAKYATLAGLPEDLHHFHVLRHTCAVQMVEKGIPMRQIADWLGHKDINSTMIYAHVSDMSRDRTAEMFFTEEAEEKKKKAEKKEIKKKGVQWGKD